MNNIFIRICGFAKMVVLVLVCQHQGSAQSVEIEGQLKLNPNFINENNIASYALVLDTNSAIAFKSVSNIGVPSTGILLSEEENNSFLLNAGFTKRGRFSMPFEQEASLLGPGSFTAISTLNNLVPGGYTAVWTGTEMIVWGGGDNITSFNDGAKYNPLSSGYLPATNINMYLYSKN